MLVGIAVLSHWSQVSVKCRHHYGVCDFHHLQHQHGLLSSPTPADRPYYTTGYSIYSDILLRRSVSRYLCVCVQLRVHLRMCEFVYKCLYTLFIHIPNTIGLKIAIVGSGHLTRKELEDNGYDTTIHNILARREDGIARFLLGRQLICVPMGFLIATITLFEAYENLYPALYFILVGLGIPGMLVTMQVAQLAPQVRKFPLPSSLYL
jgi:hypothetical protein